MLQQLPAVQDQSVANTEAGIASLMSDPVGKYCSIHEGVYFLSV